MSTGIPLSLHAALPILSRRGVGRGGCVRCTDRRFRLSCGVRLAVGAGAGKALQDRGVPDLARNLRPGDRSEEHTSELQPHVKLVRRLLLEKKKTIIAAI